MRWGCGALAAALLSSSAFVPAALANPEGGVVVGGSAVISQSGNKLDVHQHSSRTVIDWRSFNIGADEHTEFHQPSANAIALNRVNDANSSAILGKLSANGNVVLVNPNGVFFGRDAVVDVNGMVATTADIGTQEFMEGGNHFDKPGHVDAAIINAGTITAKSAGLVGLVAPSVENHGVITAKMGRVQLASGDVVTADFYGDGLLNVEVTDAQVASQFVGNTGKLEAEGGLVAMSAAAARETINSLIVVKGELSATSFGQQGGKIIIDAAGSNKTEKKGSSVVIVQASLDVSGRDEGEQGGSLGVLGDHIALLDRTVLDASGHSALAPPQQGTDSSATMSADKIVRREEDFLLHENRAGGSIKIGGDYLGSGDTQAAKTLYVSDYVVALNDALQSGDGGRTIFWSDETTDFNGLVLARGGEQGGHGGFLETSGKINLRANGFADLSIREDGYHKGSYLLDPQNITIYGNFTPDDFANLSVWLDGQDINGDGIANNPANGTALTEWIDKSGNGNNATLSNTVYNAAQQSLDVAANGGVLFNGSLMTTGTLFSLQQKIAGGDVNGRVLQDKVGGGNYLLGNWGANGHAIYINANPGDYNSGIIDPSQNTLLKLYELEYLTPTELKYYAEGNLLMHDTSANSISSVTWSTNTYGWSAELTDHRFKEFIVYDAPLTTEQRQVVEQYHATKWGVGLTTPGTGATESQKAMSATGYSGFTTDYLEYLSASADIVLQASDNITLDLQGDTMALDTGRSISLTAGANITDISAGTIRTDNGNISLKAGIAGSIALDTTNLEALNGGKVNLSAGGNIELQQDSQLNLGTVDSGGNINIQTTGATSGIIGNAGVFTDGGNITLTSGYDLLMGAAALSSSGGNITLNADRDIILSAATNADTGSINATAGRDIKIVFPDFSQNLFSYWAFDEGTGSGAMDDAGSNHASFIGTPEWSADTPFGSGYSMQFQSADGDYLLVNPYTDQSNILSVTMWAKYDNLPSANPGLFQLGAGASKNVGVWVASNGQLWGRLIEEDATTINLSKNPILNTNTWHQITTTFDGENIKQYVNGELYKTHAYDGTISDWSQLMIGRQGSESWSGNIDDVRIYHGALDHAQVSQLYSSAWTSGTTILNATRDVTFDAGTQINASAAGNALTVVAGRNVINNAGADALNITDVNARWLVYSSDPAANMLGGLPSDFKRYNRNYGGAVSETGNGLLYSIAPTLAVNIQNATRLYGDANNFSYVIDGANLIDGDTLAVAGITGVAALSSVGTQASDTGTYAIAGADGTLTSQLGYQFTYNPGTLTINKAPLTVFLSETSYGRAQGVANPAFDIDYNGFKLGQDESVLDDFPSVSTTALTNSPGGEYPITIIGGSDNNYDLIYSDPAGFLMVDSAIVLPSTLEKVVYANEGLNLSGSSSPVVTGSNGSSGGSSSAEGGQDTAASGNETADESEPDNSSSRNRPQSRQGKTMIRLFGLKVTIDEELARTFGLTQDGLNQMF